MNTNKIEQRFMKGATALGVICTAILGGLTLNRAHAGASRANGDTPPPVAAVDETPIARDSLPHGSFAPIVKKVAPGVVKIETTTRVRGVSMPDFPDLFAPFFGNPNGQQRNGPRQSPPTILQRGVGSGVVVTKDGYILTNNHVVDGASQVKVSFEDGREFTAKVIGRDPKTDLAVVKIDAKDLPAVQIADSDKVEVGDEVLAIGNPLNVGQTVTRGIVSAKDRGNVRLEQYENFIQTDAAINPGNSGGALVDIEGRLIGINTAILSGSGGSQGVGFAIPSNQARNVMDSLIKNGHVTRSVMGVGIQPLDSDLAEQFKLKDNSGALVTEVEPESPADKAGIKPGDVIVLFNGQKVPDTRRLQMEVAQTRPDSTVPVQIMRDGELKLLRVTVKESSDSAQVADNKSQNSKEDGSLNGVAVGDLDPQTRREYNIPKSVNGAVITEVDPSSAAAEAGLKPGYVILEINKHPVKSADDAVRLTEKASPKTFLRVYGEHGSHYLVVDESSNKNG